MSEKTEPVGDSIGERFRFIFLERWWYLAWFIAGVIWCAGLNIAFADTVGSDSWLGTLSVLPLYFFVAWSLLRLYRRTRAAAAKAAEEEAAAAKAAAKAAGEAAQAVD